jgi:hypothetical protein
MIYNELFRIYFTNEGRSCEKKTEATTHALKRDHVKRRSTDGMEVTQAWLDHTLFLSEC